MSSMFVIMPGIATVDLTTADRFDVLSFDWGVDQRSSMHVGGGSGAGKVEFRDVKVTKHIDEKSPSLLRLCATGTHLPEITLVVQPADPKRGETITVRMKNVLISSITAGGSADQGAPTEDVTFSFGQIEFISGDSTFAWNLAKNATEDVSRRDPGLAHDPESRETDGPEGGATAMSLRFTVYHPQEIRPNQWYDLLSYTFVQSAVTEIERHAKSRLGNRPLVGHRSIDSTRPVPRGAEIHVVPELPGCRFNPAQARFLWLEDWHLTEFRLQSAPDIEGFAPNHAVNGRIAYYVESVLIGEVPIWALLSDSGELEPQFVRNSASPYDVVFVSYAREDTAVVEKLQRAYEVLGMSLLRDIQALRSGEDWFPALLRLIDQADIFQLFWSDAARASCNVEREWRHALGREKQNFIRPVYWQRPLPEPPPELKALHFSYYESQ